MNINETVVDGSVVLRIKSPRIDAASAQAFRDALAELAARGTRRLVLDISQVNFVDSTGLGALVSSLKLLGAGGAMAICGARESVATLFRITRMDKVFRLCASEADALRHLVPTAA